MSTLKKRRKLGADNFGEMAKASGSESQFVQAGPAVVLRKRDQEILSAVSKLPEECRTPSTAVVELIRRGIDIPHSTLAQILRRLESRGLIHLDRKR
jgi:hypothetical protein